MCPRSFHLMACLYWRLKMRLCVPGTQLQDHALELNSIYHHTTFPPSPLGGIVSSFRVRTTERSRHGISATVHACKHLFKKSSQSLAKQMSSRLDKGVGSRVRSMRHYQMKSRLNIWHSLTMASFLLKHMARRDSAGVRFHDVPTRPKLGHPLANSAMIQSLRPFWVRPMDGKPRPKQGDAPTLTVGGNWRCRRVGAEGL